MERFTYETSSRLARICRLTGFHRNRRFDEFTTFTHHQAFTTLLDAVGTSQRVGMQMAGHRTPEMFRYYQDPLESQQRQAAQDLDRKLRELLDGVERPALMPPRPRQERLNSPPWALQSAVTAQTTALTSTS